MKRDMDLVRLLLIEAEASEGPLDALTLSCDAYGPQAIAYHVEMMAAHGLVDASLDRAWGGTPVRCAVNALTWDGADFLDAIRDDGIWEKTKRTVRKVADSVTLESLKYAAVTLTNSLIAQAVAPK